MNLMNVPDISVALEPNEVRLSFTILYTFIVVIIFWSLAHLKASDHLPRFIQLIFIILMVIGAMAAALIFKMSYADIDMELLSLFKYISLSFLIVILGMMFAFERLAQSISRTINLENEKKLMCIEGNYYKGMEETLKVLRMWRHDSQNQLLALRGLIEKGEYDLLDQYAKNLGNTLWADFSGFVESGITAFDAVIYSKMLIAQKENVEFTTFIEGIEILPIDTILFVSLVGNLLDNALEASTKMEDKSKAYMSLSIQRKEGILFIKLKNSSNGCYRSDNQGNLLSTKGPDRKGYGLKRIAQIVEQSGGYMARDAANDYFEITIALPYSCRTSEVGEQI